MKLSIQNPKQALNKAYLKEPTKEEPFQIFKKSLNAFLGNLNENESEEHQKNDLSDFLKGAYYRDVYAINTKGRDDLVIHNGKTTAESVGVVFENKKTNSADMVTVEKPNVKSFQQLIFYYFNEKIDHKNNEIKHLIITDSFKWFIFDENDFEKLFFRNNKLRKGYETLKQSGKDTKFFYESIAKPVLDELEDELKCTYFDLRDFKTPLSKNDAESDKKLIPLFKLLSPTHVLKLPFANDSNQLDKVFYAELLHIIGLEEIKEGSKKLINRKAEGKRNNASLLENTLFILDDRDLSRVRGLSKYGDNRQTQCYNIALELCITWVNRILFLKLLEAQLIKYHKGQTDFLFLNKKSVHDFDELNKLFFKVLAEKADNRRHDIKAKFSLVPYLNSSLFERTELENDTIDISNLDDSAELPYLSATVLKEDNGKRMVGNLRTLHYFFEFLNAYNFASEGDGDIQEKDKTLINAAVLGLIFEKINGYKDGSFFTPSFVTMYMCRESIRRAVLQKFNDRYGFNINDLAELNDRLDSHKADVRRAANDLINDLKICDPAVGSGHFLVSALNEIIAIKSELKILSYRNGDRVKGYLVTVENDELTVTDEETGDIFAYVVNEKNVAKSEIQQLQETLFHEKQTIIENCLFGVDINPNSVKICRLRLWIELLKNAFYHANTEGGVLETLPNIDINIKEGNSLISRFKLDEDLKEVFKKTSRTEYLQAVNDYKNAANKEEKEKLKVFIKSVKDNIGQTVFNRNPIVKELSRIRGTLFNLENQIDMFGNKDGDKDSNAAQKQQFRLLLAQKERELEEYKTSPMYQNSFEWRFEFPEVLDTEGVFVGFDVVVGNPPYVNIINIEDEAIRVFYQSFKTFKNKSDLYSFFTEKGIEILKKKGELGFIVSNSWLSTESFLNFRKFLIDETKIYDLIDLPLGTFAEASVTPLIYLLTKEKVYDNEIRLSQAIDNQFVKLDNVLTYQQIRELPQLTFGFNPKASFKINTIRLSEIVSFSLGIKTSDDKRFIFDEKGIGENYFKVLRGKDIDRFTTKYSDKWIWYMTALINEKAGGRPRILNNFLKEKILIKDIANKIQATYDAENYLVLDTLNVIYEAKNEYNLKFILALLNSKLINYWFASNFEAGLHIKINQLGEIPVIKDISESEQAPLIALVEQILSIKQSPSSLSTAALEAEIDRLVYGLYDLTAAEIGVIEASVK